MADKEIPSEYKLQKVLAKMRDQGFQGLLLYSNGLRNLQIPSYLQYFVEYKPLGVNNALIISKSGKAVLVVEPQWDKYRVLNTTWVKDVRGSANFSKDLIEIISELQIIEPLGLIGSREMTSDLYMHIKKEVDIELADDLIEEIAKEKTKTEIQIIRQSALIGDTGFKALLNSAYVGIREYELAAEVDFAMRLAGSDDNFILISSGKRNTALHEPTSKKLSRGDVVIAEISPIYRGQMIQLCRTIALGQPSTLLINKYELLVIALKQALRSMKPGIPSSIISRKINKIIGDAGYSEYCRPPYMRARGHGLGMGSFAPSGANRGPVVLCTQINIFQK